MPAADPKQQQPQQLLAPVPTDSSNFAFLQYFLRLSLHASTARILSAWEVSNPQLTMAFERRAQVQECFASNIHRNC